MTHVVCFRINIAMCLLKPSRISPQYTIDFIQQITRLHGRAMLYFGKGKERAILKIIYSLP